MLPIAVMTGMMLGLEDLAVQLEDPFKFMPYGELSWWTRVPRACGSCLLFTRDGLKHAVVSVTVTCGKQVFHVGRKLV
jgi:hypothetical protein